MPDETKAGANPPPVPPPIVPPPPPAAPPVPKRRPVKFVIEFRKDRPPGVSERDCRDPVNPNVQCPFYPEVRLRGRFSLPRATTAMNRTFGSESPLIALPDEIPGEYLDVDTTRGEEPVRVVEPLTLPEYADCRKMLEEAVKEDDGKEIKFESVRAICRGDDETRLKTLVYFAHRAVEAKHAVVILGSLPRLAEIDALPGTYAFNRYQRMAPKGARTVAEASAKLEEMAEGVRRRE